MHTTDAVQTYTIADYDCLVGTGQVDDRLLADLLDMARYDMQDASITVNREDRTYTIAQIPHQGDERVTLHYEPIYEIVEIWLNSEEQRTSRADIYDCEAEDVRLIRDNIVRSKNE